MIQRFRRNRRPNSTWRLHESESLIRSRERSFRTYSLVTKRADWRNAQEISQKYRTDVTREFLLANEKEKERERDGAVATAIK